MARTHPLYSGMRAAEADLLLPRQPGELPPGYLTYGERFLVPASCLLPERLVSYNASHGGSGVQYRVPAAVRAAVYAMSYPSCVLTGFGALAMYGLPFFADALETVLMHPSASCAQPSAAMQPRIYRGTLPREYRWKVQCGSTEIEVASPPMALVQALKLVKKGKAAWPVTTAPGIAPSSPELCSLSTPPGTILASTPPKSSGQVTNTWRRGGSVARSPHRRSWRIRPRRPR